MSIDIEKQRAGFEAWSRREGALNLEPARFDQCEDGRFPATYHCAMTETAWRAWANKPAAAQPAPIPAQTGKVDIPDDQLRRMWTKAGLEGRRNWAQDESETNRHTWQLRCFAGMLRPEASAGNALTEEAKDAALALAEKLIAGHSLVLRDMYCDGEPVGRQLIAAIASHIKAGQAGKDEK